MKRLTEARNGKIIIPGVFPHGASGGAGIVLNRLAKLEDAADDRTDIAYIIRCKHCIFFEKDEDGVMICNGGASFPTFKRSVHSDYYCIFGMAEEEDE